MKDTIRKIFGILGLVIGLSMICGTLYFGNKGEQIQQNAIDAITNSYEGVDISVETADEETINIIENSIGIVNIPSLDIKSAIMPGVDQGTLKYYVGYFKDSCLPGELGNFSIIGHNNNVHNKVFSNLAKINNGDIIEIITRDNKFKYKVVNKFEVYPSQSEVLEWNGQDREITVITCTNDSKKRTVVKGILCE